MTAVTGPQGIDRMRHADRGPVLAQVPADLENAADVAGEDNLGAGLQDVAKLALPQPLGHLGLGQIVAPRRAAAYLALRQGDQLQAWNQLEELPRRLAD